MQCNINIRGRRKSLRSNDIFRIDSASDARRRCVWIHTIIAAEDRKMSVVWYLYFRDGLA